jgi:uncharacterized protein (DUF1499 family)
MGERIEKLKTPDQCIIFAKNASRLGRHDLATAAKRKELRLKAEIYGATTVAGVWS